MSVCNKVKNPCKICLGPVTQKTGLQCQGVCESWVHYSCLNYTPGKIRDIKSGIIKVTCPCPDCKTTQPKEYRTDESYSCNNQQCPANRPPKCENKKCPVNSQFPSVTDMNQGRQQLQHHQQTCPLSQCGVDCKKHSTQNLSQPCMTTVDSNFGSTPQSSSSEGCPSIPCKGPMGPVGGDARQVYSVSSFSAMEEMCNTVGQLTLQINDLMNKMKQAVNRGPGCYPSGRNKSCSQKGPKTNCPKPCYCPGNPGKRKK